MIRLSAISSKPDEALEERHPEAVTLLRVKLYSEDIRVIYTGCEVETVCRRAYDISLIVA